jgi:hypothetical protein
MRNSIIIAAALAAIVSFGMGFSQWQFSGADSVDCANQAHIAEWSFMDEIIEGDWTYNVDVSDGYAKIVRYNGSDTDVDIPETLTIDGVEYPVTRIEETAFAGNDTITSVDMPSTITEIVGNPFAGCSNLAKVTIDGYTGSNGWRHWDSDMSVSVNSNGSEVYCEYYAYTGGTAIDTDGWRSVLVSHLPSSSSSITVSNSKSGTNESGYSILVSKCYAHSTSLRDFYIKSCSYKTIIIESDAFYECGGNATIHLPTVWNASSATEQMKTNVAELEAELAKGYIKAIAYDQSSTY